MELYRELYYKLAAAVSDAVESLENREPAAARKLLIAALRDTEERVISADDTEEE